MRLTVLGACGAWPEAGGAASGYLLEQDGFRLVLDLGYATLPRLLALMPAGAVDAVLVSHGHPDHCADVNPLLRARALGPAQAPPLPLYCLPGALDPVLALDRPGMLDAAYALHAFRAGEALAIGPFAAETWPLPHFVPNAGIRLTAGGRTLAYTGDSGPSPDLAALARDADLLLAEATFAEVVPERSRGSLSSARHVGEVAAQAGVRRLVLTHLWPGSPAAAAREAALRAFRGPVAVASSALTLDLG